MNSHLCRVLCFPVGGLRLAGGGAFRHRPDLPLALVVPVLRTPDGPAHQEQDVRVFHHRYEDERDAGQDPHLQQKNGRSINNERVMTFQR